jgi:glyoxylase-like metal-dependent hydrolase (beta-lactamase superfamily II)
VIIDRVEHPGWLSNAYLLADRPDGHGVLIDSNGLYEPLLERIRDDRVEITHVLVTHHHADHVVDIAGLAKRLNVPLVGHGRWNGGRRPDRLHRPDALNHATPAHAPQ